jgi:hypothetical protein
MGESFELVAFLCHHSGEAGGVCVETVALSCAVGSGRLGGAVALLANEAMDPKYCRLC